MKASGRTWKSNATGLTYDLDHIITLQDGSVFHTSVSVPDQEMYLPGGSFPLYEGHVTLTGVYKGKLATGYGIIEVFDHF